LRYRLNDEKNIRGNLFLDGVESTFTGSDDGGWFILRVIRISDVPAPEDSVLTNGGEVVQREHDRRRVVGLDQGVVPRENEVELYC